jgi:hypothetical protein
MMENFMSSLKRIVWHMMHMASLIIPYHVKSVKSVSTVITTTKLLRVNHIKEMKNYVGV